MFFLFFLLAFSVKVWYTYSMEIKTNKYVVYHNYSLDDEFYGTREECEEWIAKVDRKGLGWFFIAHESE